MTSKTETIAITIEVDSNELPQKIQDINKALMSYGFTPKPGQVFISEALINPADTQSIGKVVDEKGVTRVQFSGPFEITVDNGSIGGVSESILANAKAIAELESAVQKHISKESGIESPRMRQIIREEMLMQMFPGGILSIYSAASRG
jgi:hypothetical protein